MTSVLISLLATLRGVLRLRAALLHLEVLALEVLALRYQFLNRQPLSDFSI